MAKTKRVTGINPLAEFGVTSLTPPELIIRPVAPTSVDSQNFNIGTLWLVEPEPLVAGNQQLWMLVDITGTVAMWVQIFPGGGASASVFPTDAGVANQLAGVLNIFGDTRITTSGAGNTVTAHLSGVVPSLYQADAGFAVPSLNVLNIFGDGVVTTTGAGNTITVNFAGTGGVNAYVTDAGVAVPVAGLLKIFGGSNINTAGAGNTVTINLNNNVVIPGSLTVSSLGAGVVQTNNVGLMTSTKGLDGQTLISSTLGVPAWANITSLGGTITVTNGANTINLENNVAPPAAKSGFLVYRNSNYIVFPPPNPAVILFNTVIFDTLGNYNPVTGAFTAPVTGLYQFSVQCLTLVNISAVEISLGVNGSSNTVFGTSLNVTAQGQRFDSPRELLGVYLTLTITLHLNIGDFVQVWIKNNDVVFNVVEIFGRPAGPGGALNGPPLYSYFCGERIS